MGEVVNFRSRRLSGFIPDELEIAAEAPMPALLPILKRNLAEPICDDRACSETNPTPDNLA